MGLEALFFMILASILDPIALVLLALPGLLHARWWPRLLWAGGWAVVVTITLGTGPYGAARPLAAFVGSLSYMTLLWAFRRALEAGRQKTRTTRP